jgi:hypothetical protein
MTYKLSVATLAHRGVRQAPLGRGHLGWILWDKNSPPVWRLGREYKGLEFSKKRKEDFALNYSGQGGHCKVSGSGWASWQWWELMLTDPVMSCQAPGHCHAAQPKGRERWDPHCPLYGSYRILKMLPHNLGRKGSWWGRTQALAVRKRHLFLAKNN